MSLGMARRAERDYRSAEGLSAHLTTRLELGSVPTIDGRVIVYAPAKRGDQVLEQTVDLVRGLCRTARIVDGGDDRLAVIEVSRAGR